MNDKNRTKAQLISELEQLRQHVAELEAAATDQTGNGSFLTMAEAAASAIFVFRDSVFLYVNPATAGLTGYTVEELIGRNIWTVVHPDFRDRTERVLAFQRGEAVPPRAEFKIVTKGGETRWLNADATITEFGGSPAVLTIAYDCTEYKVAQEALRISEERYQNIMETAQEAIWVVDPRAITTYVNQRLAEMLGYPPEEILGHSVLEFVDPAERQETRRHLERGRQGFRERLDHRFRCRDGSYVWAIVSTTPLFDSAGEFIGGLAMLIDITERKRTERALKENEALLKAAIENLPFELWARETAGRCIIQNPYSVLQWGDQIGNTLEQMSWDHAIQERWLGYQQRSLKGEVVKAEFEIADGDQAGCYYSVVAPICVDAEVTGVLGVNIDITDRKRGEEALRLAQEKLHHVLLYSPSIVYSLRVEGFNLELEWISESLTRLTGYEVEEAFSGTWWVDHIHPDDRSSVIETMELLFVADRLVLEYRFQHKQKGYLWLHDEIRLLRDDSGNPIEAIGSWVDVTERREAEAALRDSEERFRLLVTSMNDTVFTLDREYRITAVFGSLTKESDADLDALIGKTARDLFEASTARVHEEAAARALAGEQVVYEWSIVNNQNTLYYQTSLSPMRRQSGEVTGLVGVGRDITERKLAEEALHASEERYRDLVENARDIIYSHDLKGNYTSVNKAVEPITGYTREEALKLNFDQSVAPEYVETARQMVAAKLAGQKETVYDLEIMAKDGRRITVEVNTRLVIQDSVPVGISGIARDVSERKRSERALRESQSHLQAILDNCPAMIFEKDLDGRYLQINRKFEQTFDVVPSQVLGRTDDDLFPQELAAGFRATDRRVIEAGHPLELEENAVYADGLHHYIVHKFPLHDVAGDIYGVGAISTEITARKRAEEELKRQKEILQKIFDHIPVMIRFLDEEDHIKLVNREWERVLGWSQNEITANNLEIFSELYPDREYRQRVMDFIAQSTGEFVDFKTRARDGRVIDTRFANVRLEDGTNIGIGRDITEIKQAEQALRRQTAELAALHEIGLEISAESDLSRILDVVTHRAAELLGAKHCSTYIRDGGEPVLNLVASLDRKFVGLRLVEGEGLAGRALVMGDALIADDYSAWPGRAPAFETEEFGPSIAAPLRWQESAIGSISLSRNRGEQPFTIGDTSLLKQLAAQAAIAIHQATLFDELQESRARLQELSHRLIDAQEAERKRLARELHDQIGQALTAIQISLQAAKSTPDGGTASIVEDCLAIIDESLELVHDLSFDLRPSLLDDLGLGAALRWYVERATARADLFTCLNVDALGGRFSPEVETACFRIAQESLTNVVRHASARTVSVTLAQKEDCLKLMVQDDGVGFDVHEAMDRKGPNTSLGLQGMRERASALGGIVEIKSSAGGGTEIAASFPLRSAGQSESLAIPQL